MKLEYNEAIEYMSKFDTDLDNNEDDLHKISKLKNIMRKYTDDVDLNMSAIHDQIYLYEFPDDGMEEEDLKTMAELGFFLEEDCITMFT